MLILCEKPSVAASFAKALGCTFVQGKGRCHSDRYIITYCVGHLYRLWDPGEYREEWKKWSLEYLPILPGEYRYRKDENTAEQAAVVDGLIKAHVKDEILIATDAGREGELIARTALREAGLEDLSRCKRFWVSEALTEEVIREGIKNAKPLAAYNQIAAQGFARQHADWLVGMNFSRYITLTGGGGEKFSVGRVQTAVLAAVVKRNEAAADFVSTPYNELELKIVDQAGAGIKALLVHPETKKTSFVLKSPYLYRALAYAKSHRDKSDLEITESAQKKIQKPEKLLNLTGLQKLGNKLYGYSPDETLSAAQTLYEKHKCLSYPRTPSRVMGDNNVELFREKFETLSGRYRQWSRFSVPDLITGSNRHIFNSAALEDHHALIPLAPLPDGASAREKNIFEIVVKSFFAVCMPDHVWKECVYTIKNGEYIYKAVTKEIIEAGWKEAFTEENDEKNPAADRALDAKNCRIETAAVLDKKTSPPKDYQIDTLLAFMEKPRAAEEGGEGKLAGLGTPATRAEIIKNLFDRSYIIEDKKKLKATAKGVWLIKRLMKDSNLRKLADVGETTAWEARLGEDPGSFEKSVAEHVAACIKAGPGESAGYEKEALGKCPLCGQKVYEGKKSYFCSAWNDKTKPCKFTVWKETAGAAVTADDVKLLLAKKETRVKQCRSKAGKKFKARFRLSGGGTVEFVFQEKRQTGKK